MGMLADLAAEIERAENNMLDKVLSAIEDEVALQDSEWSMGDAAVEGYAFPHGEIIKNLRSLQDRLQRLRLPLPS